MGRGDGSETALPASARPTGTLGGRPYPADDLEALDDSNHFLLERANDYEAAGQLGMAARCRDLAEYLSAWQTKLATEQDSSV